MNMAPIISFFYVVDLPLIKRQTSDGGQVARVGPFYCTASWFPYLSLALLCWVERTVWGHVMKERLDKCEEEWRGGFGGVSQSMENWFCQGESWEYVARRLNYNQSCTLEQMHVHKYSQTYIHKSWNTSYLGGKGVHSVFVWACVTWGFLWKRWES